MDRFLIRIRLGYPRMADEIDMMERQKLEHPLESLEQVVEVDELLQAQADVRRVTVSEDVKRYIVELVDTTREHGEVYLGASPRGSLALYRTSQALAAFEGRDYVVPDDIKRVAIPALAHRLIVGSAARIREVESRDLVQEILDRVAVPGGEVA
jgi:MoxR-like ATPase